MELPDTDVKINGLTTVKEVEDKVWTQMVTLEMETSVTEMKNQTDGPRIRKTTADSHSRSNAVEDRIRSAKEQKETSRTKHREN